MNRFLAFNITDVTNINIDVPGYRNKPFYTKSNRFFKDVAAFGEQLQSLIHVPVEHCKLSWHERLPRKGDSSAVIHVDYYNRKDKQWQLYHVTLSKVGGDWLLSVKDSYYIGWN